MSSPLSTSWGADTSPYQMWRLVVHATPVSFMVSWQFTPRGSTAFLTLQSVHTPVVIPLSDVSVGQGPSWVHAHEARLGERSTDGRVAPVAWSLRWEPIAPVIRPLRVGAGKFLPWSTDVVSYPAVRFSGTIMYGEERWEGEGWGTIHRWWGRNLPPRWFWVHAGRCPPTNGYLEGWWASVPVGGRQWPRLSSGYFWLHDGQHAHLWVHPWHGTLEVIGPPDTPRLRVVPWHGTGLILACRVHPRTWQKLAPDHMLTLTGEARVLGGMACLGRTVIEWRHPPVY